MNTLLSTEHSTLGSRAPVKEGLEDSSARHVAIFGAGIAGLSAAHELVRRGYRVNVYESGSEAGGFFRSARMPRTGNLPTEYSWHGMGPWYHNLFDLLKQIPFDDSGSVYEKALSRPIAFGIFPDAGKAEFFDRGLRSIPRMFRISTWEWLKWSWLMLKTWSANVRSQEKYSRLNAAEQWQPLLSEQGYKTWRSCFGPWIGSDWTKASLHHAGQFFRKQLISQPRHLHPADDQGPAWSHGAGDGWLLLRGPSSEFWFDRWIKDLEHRGVSFSWNERLERLHLDDDRISGGWLESGTVVSADLYILATNPFAAAEIIARTPELERQEELRLFKPLIQDGPHIQVSFRIGFAEPIKFPRERTAVVVADSEFNLTLFAEEQAWSANVDLGRNLKSLWTGTSCVGTVPGRLFQLPVSKCTKEQFLAEVKIQIMSCQSLNELIKEANGGRGLAEFEIAKIEVWHEWTFSPEGIRSPQPKWVTSMNTQPYLPSQVTPISNLFLAGAHTRTEADVWSIEGAVESGRRAARAIDSTVQVISQHKPWWLRIISSLDDVCYRVGAPHVLDLLLVVLSASAAATILGLLIESQAFAEALIAGFYHLGLLSP